MPKMPKPADAEAPAYFVQYAALWCLMLAFFVTLLSLGTQKSAQYKEGMGAIKNAFGIEGGFGLLPYSRGHNADESSDSAIDSFKSDIRRSDQKADLVGYFKNMLWKEGLSSVSILKIQVDELGARIALQTPIEFVPGRAVLDVDTRKFLNKIATIFYTRPDLQLSISTLVRDLPTTDENLMMAMERSGAVARYLQEVCRISPDRLDIMGYNDTRYLSYLPDLTIRQAVLFNVSRPSGEPEDIEI